MALICTISASAQINEIGVFLGGSNYIGDIGKTNYIAPSREAIGLVYKWNQSKRHAWRLSATRATIIGNDLESELNSRKERGYSFENTITEFSGGLEFNFFDFDLIKSGGAATPYLYTGISYFRSDDLYFNGTSNQAQINSTSGGVAIPIIAGLKFKLTRSFVLGLEAGARYTFQDDLDGSLSKTGNINHLKFGNTNSNDWYVFTGATITYTFGKKPCYCTE